MGFIYACVMNAQDPEVHAVMVEPEFKKGYLDYGDDSLSFTFNYWARGGQLKVSVFNRTKSTMYVEWEDARFDHSRIVFGDDTRYSMRNAKHDEAVPSFTRSIERDIYPEKWFTSDYTMNFIEESTVRWSGGYKCDISIPIRFGSGSVKYYHFLIHVYCFNPVDCGCIKIGMKAKEVKNL